MEMNKKRSGGDGETHLPREIIHHIQSFLKKREAAQTSLLSKWWYSAWSTRPNLAFELRFPKGSEFAKKTSTMQRYEDEKLRIQSLKVSQLNPNLDSNDLLLAKELLVKAMKLGAVDLHITFWNRSFVLPDEVLQSKTLASLHFSGFTVNLPSPPMKITFSKLKSLALILLTVKGDLIRDLISRCPSTETLQLHEIKSCYGDFNMNGFQLGKLEFLHLSSSLKLKGSLARFSCLKELSIWGNIDMKDVRVCSRSLEQISIYLSISKILTAEFDVPNLRKFLLRGGSPSSRLDFKSSRGWDSEIRLSCYKRDEIIIPSWFSSLNQLLKMLRNSRVFLSIDVDMGVHVNGGDGLASLVVAVVDTLRLNGKEINSAFVDNLFSICRPKRIIQDYVWRNPMKREMLVVDYEKMAKEVMDVKVLEERFGKYSSLSWNTLSLAPCVYYQCRWNLDHSICP